MYFNNTARKQCLNKAQLTRGGQLFSRRVQSYPLLRRHVSNSSKTTSDLSFRCIPSPRRRVSTVEPNHHITKPNEPPIRAHTGSSFGSIPSPIPEDHMTSTPLHTPDTPPSSRASIGGFRFSSSDMLPFRSVSAESAAQPRSPGLRRQKHSRVLVVPSVATVTFVPQPPDSPSSSRPPEH